MEEWYSENGVMIEKGTPLLRKQSVPVPSVSHKFKAKWQEKVSEGSS